MQPIPNKTWDLAHTNVKLVWPDTQVSTETL